MKSSTTQSYTAAISSSSWGSNNSGKYAGMIQVSWKKKTEQNFLQLYSYIHSVAPKMSVVHIVVSILRIAQMIIPSLQPCEVFLWGPESSQPYQTISYLTVIATYFPLKQLYENWFYVLLVMAILKACMLLLFYFSSIYYSKNAVLPKSVPIILSTYLSTIGILLEPPCWSLVGKILGDIIFDQKFNQYISKIIFLIINVLLSVLYFIVFIHMNFRNLQFHDFSLQTVLGFPQEIIFSIVCTMNFSVGISSNTSKISTYIFTSLMTFEYIGLLLICFNRGGLIKPLFSNVLKSVGITGAFLCIFQIIYITFVGTIDLILLWIGLISFIIITVIAFVIDRYRVLRILDTLDLFENDGEIEGRFKTVNSLINSIVIGFSNSHPCCIDWSIFRAGVECWPRNMVMWTIFAKFAAIYPSEVGLLSWIFHTVKQNKLKGGLATSIKQNIIAIMRQREATLTPELKNKISTLTKSITSAKLKLRHVWDAVIQGNTGEVEVMSKNAIAAAEKLEADFKHILRQFPNNRFVTRSYICFLRDIQADHEMAIKYQEKSKLLGRGVSIVSDEPHELGMIAFPNIPDQIKSENSSPGLNETTLNITVTEDIIADDETKDELELEKIAYLKKHLNELKVPTTRNLIIASLSIFLLLYIIPFVIFIVLDLEFPSSLQNESSIIQTITVIRCYNSMTPLLTAWYIYETMGVLVDPKLGELSVDMIAFNNRSTSYELVNVALQKFTQSVQDLESAIGSFDTSTPELLEAYNNLTDDKINFTYYNTYDDREYLNCAVMTSLLMVIQSVEAIQTTPKEKVETLRNHPCMLNPMFCSLEINVILNDVMNVLIANGKNTHKNTQTEDYIYFGVFSVFFVVAQIVYQVLEIKFLVFVKVETYKSLIALPKNVVSQIAEQLRVLKKDSSQTEYTQNDASDINKQEENIIKVFATSGSNAAMDDVIILCSSLGIICILYVISTFMLTCLTVDITNEYVRSAPHINYFMGSIAMRFGAVFNLLMLSIDQDKSGDYAVFHDPGYWAEWGPTYLSTSMSYMNSARFGGTSEIDTPLASYTKLQNKAYLLTACSADEPYKPWKNYMRSIRCLDPEGIQLLHNLMIIQAFHVDNYSRLENGLKDDRYEATENREELKDIFSILIYYLYDNFYYRSFKTIIPEMEERFKTILNYNIMIASLMIALSLIAELVHVWRIKFIEKHVKDVMKMLLHCPINAIFQTPKIMDTLNGNFKPAKNDKTNRNEKFFRDVVDCIPDAIILTRTDFGIVDANSFCDKLLGKSKEELVEKDIYETFYDLNFTGDLKKLTPTQNQSEVLTCEGKIVKGEEISNVIVEMSHVNNLFVYLIRDNTQTVRYNTLISEERKKSDDLLASILPASLVKRVQAGEKNISFSVQSATVLFLDVVSFTPWCGSHDAKTVMDTLNLFFKKLDYLASTYPTITKIKCIGDCYMCAGGIFMEVNQPTEHAREVVSFGLDALDALQEVNKEMNQELQIRVGINSGGPLVAGVLGVGKPTFEILGPTINMAQQMEHHGVPSKVHVSRSVYELIYGDSFVIRERGSIEVKQGKVVTYLVERKN